MLEGYGEGEVFLSQCGVMGGEGMGWGAWFGVLRVGSLGRPGDREGDGEDDGEEEEV